MSNEQLRQALRNAGLEPADLAVKAEVDVKTVRRWLSGRTPRSRYRRLVADALDVPERALWPDVPTGADQGEELGETVDVYPASDSVDWRELVADAQQRVDLLDLTLSDVIIDGDEQLIADAAARGCRVRVLISDADSVHLLIAEQDAGRHVGLIDTPASVADLARVFELLAPQAQRGELALREFVDAGAYRVLIFDDQALVRFRLAGADADATPVLYLTRESSGGLFESFSQHFETIWARSEPLR